MGFHITQHPMGTAGGSWGRHIIEPTSQGASSGEKTTYGAKKNTERLEILVESFCSTVAEFQRYRAYEASRLLLS